MFAAESRASRGGIASSRCRPRAMSIASGFWASSWTNTPRSSAYMFTSRLRRPPRWTSERVADLSERQLRQVDQWNEVFADEIEAVRRTRNVAVHEPRTVSSDTLRGAVENTRVLRSILLERLGLG